MGAASDGARFAKVFMGIQGPCMLPVVSYAWHCQRGFSYPYFMPTSSESCWKFKWYLTYIFLVLLIISGTCLVSCIAVLAMVYNPWVGRYKRLWWPFTILWVAGGIYFSLYRRLVALLYWFVLCWVTLSWISAVSAALAENPEPGRTAAELARARGFLKVASLLEEA
jgi:hypothetical protein